MTLLKVNRNTGGLPNAAMPSIEPAAQQIAIIATTGDYFAVAEYLCAVHKDPAFQASSPKT